MKNMTVPVAVAVAIIGCVLAVSANVTTSDLQKSLEEERYKRIAAEQMIQKSQSKIARLEKGMTDSQKKLNAIEQIFNEGKTTTKDLQAELKGVSKEKEILKKEVKQLQSELKKIQQANVPPKLPIPVK